MNIVILVGRLTRDPEIRYSQNAEETIAVARFTLAVDRRGSHNNHNNEQQTADFVRCVAFRKRAEFVEKYLYQGTKIIILGSLRIDNYTNKDGQKVYYSQVIIDNIEFAEGKKSDMEIKRNLSMTDEVDNNEFMNIPDGIDDELPFD